MKLSPIQERFIENYLRDETNAAAAYIQAGYKVTQQSAYTLAARALERPSIKTAIAERRARMREEAHLSRMDVVGFLCETIKTPVGQVDETHRQAQEFSVDEAGEITTRTRVKMPAKLEAIKILNQMMGWNAPEEVKHNHQISIVIGGDAE